MKTVLILYGLVLAFLLFINWGIHKNDPEDEE